jgi:hypothetical protein
MGTATVRNVSRRVRLSAFVVACVFAVGIGGGALAQDPTPDPNAIVTHPAHIHVGSCAELDPNPKAPLNDVGPQMKDDDELPTSEDIKGSLGAASVEVSKTEDVEVSFDDLLNEAHAINVHESAQAIENYIACGDIGGPVIDDKLWIGLLPQNNSGYAGVAQIEKDGDDQVTVTIYLVGGLAGEPGAPATPTA